MDFRELEQQLISLLQAKVRSGEVTERSLARIIGLSQPHVHNVLKGKRSLSMETADAILHRLRVDLTDLMGREESAEAQKQERRML